MIKIEEIAKDIRTIEKKIDGFVYVNDIKIEQFKDFVNILMIREVEIFNEMQEVIKFEIGYFGYGRNDNENRDLRLDLKYGNYSNFFLFHDIEDDIDEITCNCFEKLNQESIIEMIRKFINQLEFIKDSIEKKQFKINL
jgi:hypothetical protein